jgi:hypothetical protein
MMRMMGEEAVRYRRAPPSWKQFSTTTISLNVNS